MRPKGGTEDGKPEGQEDGSKEQGWVERRGQWQGISGRGGKRWRWRWTEVTRKEMHFSHRCRGACVY